MNFNTMTKTDIMCKEVSNKVKGVYLRQYSISCYASLNSKSLSRSQRIHDGLGMDITLSNGLTIFTGRFAGCAKLPKQFLSGIQEAPTNIIETFKSDIGRIKECLLEAAKDIQTNGNFISHNGKFVSFNAMEIAENCFSNNDDACCYFSAYDCNTLEISLKNRFRYGLFIEDKNSTVSFTRAECVVEAIENFANSINEEALVKELESTLKEVVKVAEEAYTEALMREKAKRSKKAA